MNQTLSHKTAVTSKPVLDAIAKRWSPRAFNSKPIETDKLVSILEAGRWAASAFNEQPWRFILATREQPEAFEKALNGVNDFNRSWAQTAGAIIITVAKKSFSQNGNPNKYAWHDVGLAVSQMIVQATDLDVYVHQMAGILPEVITETYNIPEEYEPVSALVLGYVGDAETLPEQLKNIELAKRERKPLSDLVFSEEFGKSTPLL